ncbi:Galectin-4 [Atta colombica]|uniref:Galectin-4 n=1 Tax=Atta colombica TaxID=520822 RepID=A0A151HXZ3_9HYME|nr:Galectin-4 [Atta colombica]
MEPSVFLPQSEDFPVLIIQRGGVDALLEKTLHATSLLRRLSATKHLYALQALKRPTTHWDDLLVHLLTSINAELHEHVSRVWQMDDISTQSHNYTMKENICERHFLDNVSQNSQGRYIIKLPVREQMLNNIGDSRESVLKQLRGIERRFKRDPILKIQYAAFLDEYLSLGHMERWIAFRTQISNQLKIPRCVKFNVHQPIVEVHTYLWSDSTIALNWITSPNFFRKWDEEHWPPSVFPRLDNDLPEQRKIRVLVSTFHSCIIDLLNKHSNLNKICRIIAYCLRLSKAYREHRISTFVSPVETSTTLDCICRTMQQRAFYREYEVLVKNEIVNTSSNILSLSSFLDESGLMRIGGKLKNSNLAFNACHSILLPRKYILTQRIIERERTRNLHADLQATMAFVRQHFWPLSLRRCSVDYAGPLLLREGNEVPITVDIGSKFCVGARLFIVGRLKLLPHSFYINLQKGKTIYPHPIILLHLNPRFLYGNSEPYVVMNYWNNGTWGHEERHQGQLSWMPGRDFVLIIRCEYEGYTIWLANKMIGEFKHKLESSNADTLRISGDVVLYQLSMSYT